MAQVSREIAPERRPPKPAPRTSSDEDQRRSFIRRDLGEPLGSVADLDPLIGTVDVLFRNEPVEKSLTALSRLHRRHALILANRASNGESVDHMCEEQAEPKLLAQRAGHTSGMTRPL